MNAVAGPTGARIRFAGYALRSLVSILLLCVSCRHPTSPTNDSVHLNLQPGPTLLFFGGADISSDPQLPVCTNIGLPRDGKALTTKAVLTLENREWIARSASPEAGDFEIRLHGAATIGATPIITGSVSGNAKHIQTPIDPFPKDVQLTFVSDGGLPATVDGTPPSGTSKLLIAYVNGSLFFADASGAGGRCTRILMMLQPLVSQ